jgi:hypothetical protein
VPPIRKQSQDIAFQSCNVTWPQDRSPSSSVLPSVASTPRYKFILIDLTLKFPPGELSLICGKLGSGKTLLLLGESKQSLSFHSIPSSGFNLNLSFSVTRRGRYPRRTDAVPPVPGRLAGFLRGYSPKEGRLGHRRHLCIRASGTSRSRIARGLLINFVPIRRHGFRTPPSKVIDLRKKYE